MIGVQVGLKVVNLRSALKKTFGGYAHASISVKFSTNAETKVGVSDD